MFTRRSTALDSVLDSDGHTTDAGSRNRAKRASLQGAYSGQGLRAGHVQNMLLLLQDRLLEHRYEEASSIAVALSQTAKTADIAAQKLDVVEVVWKAALAILSSRIMGRQIWIEHMDKPLDEMLYNEGPMASQQGITDDQHGEPMHVRKRETFQIARSILRLLKQLLQNIYNPPSQLIVEYLLQHIRFGILDEAIETLERYITRYPYRDDALLLGYAGILLYIKIRTRYDVAQKDIIHTSEFRQALMHFEASFKIDFSQEMFLYYYLKLLFMSDLAKAQRAAEKFVRQNPKNIFALRYLLEIHRAQNAEPAEWLQIAETILLLDPVAPIQQTLKPIIEHYESVMAPDESGEVLMDDGGVVRCSELIVSFLGNRLDYGSVEESRDGVSDLWLWGKLLRFVMLLRHIDPQYRFGEAWQERGSWWLDVYYPVPSEGQQPTEVEEVCLVIKAMVAKTLFPTQYPKIRYLERHGIDSSYTLSPSTLDLLSSYEVLLHELLGIDDKEDGQVERSDRGYPGESDMGLDGDMRDLESRENDYDEVALWKQRLDGRWGVVIPDSEDQGHDQSDEAESEQTVRAMVDYALDSWSRWYTSGTV